MLLFCSTTYKGSFGCTNQPFGTELGAKIQYYFLILGIQDNLEVKLHKTAFY